jgi:hypothetical protein
MSSPLKSSDGVLLTVAIRNISVRKDAELIRREMSQASPTWNPDPMFATG